jgi:hypothetical protein
MCALSAVRGTEGTGVLTTKVRTLTYGHHEDRTPETTCWRKSLSGG